MKKCFCQGRSLIVYKVWRFFVVHVGVLEVSDNIYWKSQTCHQDLIERETKWLALGINLKTYEKEELVVSVILVVIRLVPRCVRSHDKL